jgi:ribonuclease D
MMTVITDTDTLARFCARQMGSGFIAVDTEFMRERTYWPILCLVQVAGPEEAAAIDALAPGIDLTPLLNLMADQSTLKVFHAARQDIEIFFNLSGAVPASNGRASWFAEEMAELSNSAIYRSDPGEAWRRFRLRGRVDPRFFSVLREVAAWRETAARQRNLPRGRIMRDEAVLEIASHIPKTVEALARTRSLGKGVAEGKLGAEIIEAIARGLADTAALDPPASLKIDAPPGAGPLVELLRVLLKQRCEEHQVAQKLLASADDLDAIAADDEAPVRALSGWRREIFGKDALALKHGRLALTVRRNRISLIELSDRE